MSQDITKPTPPQPSPQKEQPENDLSHEVRPEVDPIRAALTDST